MFRKFALGVTATSLYTLHKYNGAEVNYENQPVPKTHKFALTLEEKQKLNILNNINVKPVIVALYDKKDGTTNTDLAIEHFEDKGMEVVRVPSETGLDHPIFADQNNKINGILLPGGPDVPVNNPQDPRKKFENQLIQLGKENDIPVLGICRGEQTIGNYYGWEVKDLPVHDEHYSHEDEICQENIHVNCNNKVIVAKGSQLYNALHHKFKNESDGVNPIEYSVTCMHSQHIMHNVDNTNGEVKVTAHNPFDNTIDGIEIRTGNYYTIGLQHHPEAVIKYAKLTRKDAVNHIRQERDEALMAPHHFSDSEFTFFNVRKIENKISEAKVKSRHEKAARAEMGLFIDQTRKKFLETVNRDEPKILKNRA